MTRWLPKLKIISLSFAKAVCAWTVQQQVFQVKGTQDSEQGGTGLRTAPCSAPEPEFLILADYLLSLAPAGLMLSYV